MEFAYPDSRFMSIISIKIRCSNNPVIYRRLKFIKTRFSFITLARDEWKKYGHVRKRTYHNIRICEYDNELWPSLHIISKILRALVGWLHTERFFNFQRQRVPLWTSKTVKTLFYLSSRCFGALFLNFYTWISFFLTVFEFLVCLGTWYFQIFTVS